MRYASIRNFDITNGEGIGVALFVQGCPFHCKGCFNECTWDFDGGEEWTEDVQEKFFEFVNLTKRLKIAICHMSSIKSWPHKPNAEYSA